MNPIVAVILLFVGCSSNVIFLELLITEFPGSGNIVTFSQFLFISIHGFVTYAKFGSRKPSIPLRKYINLVILYFLVNVTNNYALNFNISLPLHMIFRSGSLMANMVLGMIILKKKYTVMKYLSVLMISVGICVCTLASSHHVKKHNDDSLSAEDNYKDYVTWIFGLSMLTFALFMSARLGIFQEIMYSKHGKHPDEALFYCHALPLPGFLFVASDIYNHALLFTQSAHLVVPFIGISLPKMWIYLIGNVVTQFVCIRGVYILTTEYTSLTVTLLVTLRKFFSLLFSIFYFKNVFNIGHWLGTFLVFSGTFLFSDIFGLLKRKILTNDEKSK